jgi:hypothetical protein
MMKKGDFKFIYTHGIISQLYDVKNDPDELNNLIFDKKYTKVYQDMYFQTLVNWNFQQYSPIEVALVKNKITWNKTDEFSNYAIYYSSTSDIMAASLIADNVKNNFYEISKQGYFWLVAKPKLTKTSDFYGKDIPVGVEKYSYTLPVSMVMQYGR